MKKNESWWKGHFFCWVSYVDWKFYPIDFPIDFFLVCGYCYLCTSYIFTFTYITHFKVLLHCIKFRLLFAIESFSKINCKILIPKFVLSFPVITFSNISYYFSLNINFNFIKILEYLDFFVIIIINVNITLLICDYIF